MFSNCMPIWVAVLSQRRMASGKLVTGSIHVKA
jgi:hypothetical protein